MNTPADIFDDIINQPVENVPLDFLPEIIDHSDPFYLVQQHEEDIIEHFGVNLNGNAA